MDSSNYYVQGKAEKSSKYLQNKCPLVLLSPYSLVQQRLRCHEIQKTTSLLTLIWLRVLSNYVT